MKLESPENPVQIMTDGKIKQHTMRLTSEARRKVFNMLSKPYSNPISAVIRELSTNASDEHIKYSVNKPFDVHMPTSSRLWFTVRDYANGLSEQGMEDYCSYSHSDKVHSNDYNGCLGIGSKSPFSYTDGYTIVSRHKGVKYVYNLFIGEDGIPAHVLVGQEPTTEPSGLEIQVPVKQENVASFTDMAKKIYQWFDVKPNFVGSNLDIPEMDYSVTGDGFAMRSEASTSFADHSISIVMGQVEYNFPIHYSDFSDDFTDFNDFGLILFVDNGNLEFEPGRERISKTNKNIRYIEKRLTEIRDNLADDIREEINNCDCYFDAMLKYQSVKSHKTYRTVFVNTNVAPLEYNGKKIEQYIETPSGCGVIEKYDDDSKKKLISSIYPSPYLHFIIDDSKKGGYAQFMRVVEYDSVVHARHNYLLKGEQSDIDALISHYEIPKDRVSCISDYPTYLDKVVRSVPLSDDVMIFNKDGYRPKNYWKKDKNFDFNQGGYYVSFNNYGYNHPTKTGTVRKDADNLNAYYKCLEHSKGKNVVLVGAKKSVLDEFVNSPDWTDILEEVENMTFTSDMSEHVSYLLLCGRFSYGLNRYCSNFDDYQYLRQFSNVIREAVELGEMTLDDFSDDIIELHTNIQNCNTDYTLIEYYNNIFQCKGIGYSEVLGKLVDIKPLEELCKRISEKYPLLRHIDIDKFRKRDRINSIKETKKYIIQTDNA